MKWSLILGLGLIVACGTAWASYSVGYRRGCDQALILENGTFVGTFDALEKLRSGDVEGGTRRIETLCFAAANTVYSGKPA